MLLLVVLIILTLILAGFAMVDCWKDLNRPYTKKYSKAYKKLFR